MENQRLILFAALMFVAFLLWQNWMEFKAKKYPPPAPPVATAPANPANPTGASAPGVPGQDVPIAAPAVNAGPQALGGGQRVHVTTDLFEAEIDTVGGDLRRVGLRTYPESILHLDQPFQLMKDGGPEIFIAQSGLVALDNAPAPNHYAQFSVEQTDFRLADGQDLLEALDRGLKAVGL